MTSEPQTPPFSVNVPRYFADFILENARQHAELAAQIGYVRVENARQHAELDAQIGQVRVEMAQRESRLIKWIIGSMTAFTMAWSGAMYGIVRVLTDTLG